MFLCHLNPALFKWQKECTLAGYNIGKLYLLLVMWVT